MTSQLPLDLGPREHASFDTFWPEPDREAKSITRRFALGDEAGALYLWGKPGSGKSHLLLAASRLAAERGLRPVVLSLAGSGPGAARPGALDGLARCDLVCIDDVGAAAGGPGWERALFGLYRELEAAPTRLIAAARTSPAGAGFGLPDLVSRMRRSLVVHLRGLDDLGTLEVWRARAAGRGLELSDDVLHYVARRGRRDMHSLSALLDRLDRLSLAERRRITVPLVRRALDG